MVCSYPTYEGAQRAVDFLSDSKFPVERTVTIGSDMTGADQVLQVCDTVAEAEAAFGG